ncbi:phage tail protein [Lysobacter arvi]|uniref:Phage tail protein n=1 Tax=Lysobacter arvi TaxID=3038776 RepID=A0ABU1CB29_9GAMM|nr:phage tail protein [Lysobacter arvi]MDR0182404.1 phage tail protein [Lysobacter arvi]
MIKPGSLREHLVAALPRLSESPDKLLVFIDAGRAIATGVETMSFEYRYNLNLVLTDFSGGPDDVFVPLLQWVRLHQRELLDNPQRRDEIRFEADLLDHGQVDLSITLPLTERVIVRQQEGGGIAIAHAPEPELPPAIYGTP